MEKNKTGKYLKYAIGEIVLVVIGILIALSINNWNESRKEEEIRQGYYVQLLEEISKDKKYLEETITDYETMRNAYNTYLTTFEKKDMSINQALENQNKGLKGLNVLWFNTNTIESLKSTGDIKLIPKIIRNRLIDLNRSQNRTILLSNNYIVKGSDFVELILLESGSLTLDSRLKNQPILKSLLKLEGNYPKLFLLKEAFKAWTIQGESVLSHNLKEMLAEETVLVDLIKNELRK